MPALIALSGKKYSGKSTLAKVIARELGVPLRNFAGPLKAGCQMMGIEIDGPDKDVDTLQHIGVFLREKKSPDHWVNTLFRNNPDYDQTGMVVDDLRFPNEFDALASRGFLIVRIHVSRATQIDRATNMGIDPGEIDFDHASETALDSPEIRWDLELGEDLSVADRLDAVAAQLAFLARHG